MDIRGKAVCVLAASVGMLILQSALFPAAVRPQETTVDWRMTMLIDYPELGIQDTVRLWGPAELKWLAPYPSPLFPPHLEIDSRIDTIRLRNRSGVWGRELPGFPIMGKAYLLDPEPWVESFFDVTFEMVIPERFPKDTLSFGVPVRTFGLPRGWPPYFDRFESEPGMPPVPLLRGDGSTAAMVLSIEHEMIPHYEPEVRLSVSTAYLSEVAIVGEDGMIHMSAGLAGDYSAEEAIFSYRPCGDLGPFVPFHVDTDGSARALSTIQPMGSGDGWSAYFDPGSEPFEGQCVQFEAALLIPPYGVFKDTVDVWVDPTPPIPSFFDINATRSGITTSIRFSTSPTSSSTSSRRPA